MAHLSLRDIDIVIISLTNRTDRRTVIAAALERQNLAFSFFDAIPAPEVAPEGWKLSLPLWGCSESHISILEKATRPTLVLEDDAVIPARFSDISAVLFAELPAEWAVLRLGGAHVRPPEKYSEHLVRSRGALYPHAYLVRDPAKAVAGARRQPIDWATYFMLQDRRNHQTYATNPWLINTSGSPSDIPDSIPIADRAAKQLVLYTPDGQLVRNDPAAS